jgi:hypothetical protein
MEEKTMVVYKNGADAEKSELKFPAPKTLLLRLENRSRDLQALRIRLAGRTPPSPPLARIDSEARIPSALANVRD